MSYTQTKVTYIGTNENELELEKKGVKPDYYEYDQAIANGDIKTNYDTLQTTWHKDGIARTTTNPVSYTHLRAHETREDLR